MISKDFFLALDTLEKEKGIDKQTILRSLETALAVAYKKNFGEASNVVVKTNPDKATIRIYSCKTIVREVVNPEAEISLDEARQIKKSYKVGDEVLTEIFPKDFGRIAAQNAVQMVKNSLHQAEKDVMYNQFADKENELLIGVVSRVKDDGTIFVEIGKNQTEGILTVNEQIPGETYRAGDRIKVLVKRVKEGTGDFGYNARADRFENLCAAGVIDPAKVTRVALENAASIAGMFLTTECVIADKKEETPAAPAMNPGMGGMGGMM